MKRSLLSAVSMVILLGSVPVSHALTPSHLWSRIFGTMDTQCAAVAVDGSGNVYVTGCFMSTVDFGGGDLVSAGALDVVVAKYNSAGVHQWSKRFGSTGLDRGWSIAVDGSGNVYVTGEFHGTVNLGGGNLVSAGGFDEYLAKFDTAGVHQWSKRFGGTLDDDGLFVALDSSGNVYVTGNFQGTANFGGGDLVSAGGNDIFLAKYNSAGVHQWSKRFGSTVDDVSWKVAVDHSSSVIVTGGFGGTVDFGGGNLVSVGGDDVFVAKYNSAGVHQWSERFGSSLNDAGVAVTVDGSSNVYVTGEFQGTVDFGGGAFVSGGGYDIFVAKYTSAGVHRWSKRFGGTLDDVGLSVATDSAGNVYVTGVFQGTVDFGGGNLVSAGDNDIFVAKYTSAGVHRWSQRFGSAARDVSHSLAVDGSSNVVIGGDVQGTVNFGGGDLGAEGDWGMFLAKFGPYPVEPVVSSILDVRNDQGRRVRIEFDRSGYDASAGSVVQYEAYRRNDTLPAAPTSLLSRAQLLDQGWVYAGAVPAHGVNDYLMDAPTDADSTITSGQHYSAFFIRGATSNPVVFYDSPVDSGYSLDNRAPGVPGNVVYMAGSMRWDKSTAEDFDYFSVYGAATNDFASATLLNYCVEPRTVNLAPFAYYFVTATDFSGNEGKPAVINALTGVGGTPTSYVLSISAYPNPFNPATTIRYTVPSKGHVSVAVYDVHGACVATLFEGERNAGAYTAQWDGHAAAGAPVGSGVYFARITHASGTKSYKVVLVK